MQLQTQFFWLSHQQIGLYPPSFHGCRGVGRVDDCDGLPIVGLKAGGRARRSWKSCDKKAGRLSCHKHGSTKLKQTADILFQIWLDEFHPCWWIKSRSPRKSCTHTLASIQFSPNAHWSKSTSGWACWKRNDKPGVGSWHPFSDVIFFARKVKPVPPDVLKVGWLRIPGSSWNFRKVFFRFGRSKSVFEGSLQATYVIILYWNNISGNISGIYIRIYIYTLYI